MQYVQPRGASRMRASADGRGPTIGSHRKGWSGATPFGALARSESRPTQGAVGRSTGGGGLWEKGSIDRTINQLL